MPEPQDLIRWNISANGIAACFGVFAAALALYIKADDFLIQRPKAHSVTYANQMIDFVDNLKSNNTLERERRTRISHGHLTHSRTGWIRN